jgi:hypothetical protein
MNNENLFLSSRLCVDAASIFSALELHDWKSSARYKFFYTERKYSGKLFLSLEIISNYRKNAKTTTHKCLRKNYRWMDDEWKILFSFIPPMHSCLYWYLSTFHHKFVLLKFNHRHHHYYYHHHRCCCTGSQKI